MAESDPKIAPQDWFAVRKRNARAGLRKLVSIIAENRTDRAEGPLPLHKSVYMSDARNAAEMEHIFRNEPIVAGLSGDIPFQLTRTRQLEVGELQVIIKRGG